MTEARIVKVTVIIEDGEDIITNVFHKTYNLETRVNYREMGIIRPNMDGGFRPMSKIDFQINGVGVFDPEHGNYMETKREKKDA